MIGPGKYDDACTLARVSTQATACLLIVLGGKHGNGFSCQTEDSLLLLKLPDLLEAVAAQIRVDGGTPS